MDFISPSKGKLSVGGVISDIADFVSEDHRAYYKLVIGTDSQIKGGNGKKETDFVTALVIHKVGKGAKYFWRKKTIERAMVLREKIYMETTISLTTAEEIVPEIRKAISPGIYDLEIHIDVGPLGPTREMIKEVVGMVNGSGYVAKTKPESWGASTVADKHT